MQGIWPSKTSVASYKFWTPPQKKHLLSTEMSVTPFWFFAWNDRWVMVNSNRHLSKFQIEWKSHSFLSNVFLHTQLTIGFVPLFFHSVLFVWKRRAPPVYICLYAASPGSTTASPLGICPHPGTLTNGRILRSCCRGGDLVLYSCNAGFTIQGSFLAVCLRSNGRWSQPKPTCIPAFPGKALESSCQTDMVFGLVTRVPLCLTFRKACFYCFAVSASWECNFESDLCSWQSVISVWQQGPQRGISGM